MKLQKEKDNLQHRYAQRNNTCLQEHTQIKEHTFSVLEWLLKLEGNRVAEREHEQNKRRTLSL